MVNDDKPTLSDRGLANRDPQKQVGLTGIEPALPKELDPKSSASASSATAPLHPGGFGVESVLELP